MYFVRPETQKHITDWLKYIGMVLTTGLSIYSLRSKTVFESKDPLTPNTFTPAGFKYLIGFCVTAALTVLASAWGDRLDIEFHRISERQADQRFQSELEKSRQKQSEELMRKNREELTKTVGAITDDLRPRFESQRRELNRTFDSLTTRMRDANNELSSQLLSTQTDISLSETPLGPFAVVISSPDVPLYDSLRDKTTAAAVDAYVKKVCDREIEENRAASVQVSSDRERKKCIAAEALANEYRTYSRLLDHLDPSGHMSVGIQMSLRGIYIESANHRKACHLPDEDMAYDCPMFLATPRTLSLNTHSVSMATSSGREAYPGVEARDDYKMELFVSNDGLREIFGEVPPHFRDIMFEKLTLTVCDLTSESVAERAKHLRNYRDHVRLELTLTGDERGSDRSFGRAYKLARLRSSHRSIPCFDLLYGLAPGQ